MKKNIVIIILSVVILGLGGYFVYDKFIDRDVKNDNEATSNVENKEENEQKDNEVQVVDLVNFTFDRSSDPIVCEMNTIDGIELIRIPVLESNKKGAQELNKVIKKDLEKWIERTKLDEETYKNTYQILTSNYVYYKDVNYISLKILVGQLFPCRGGGSIYYTYNYDIVNDKQLSNEELLELYNVSENDIIERFKQTLALKTLNTYSEEMLESIKDYKLYIDEFGYLVVTVHFGPATGILEEKFISRN